MKSVCERTHGKICERGEEARLSILRSDAGAPAEQQQHDGALRVEDRIVQGRIPLVILCLQVQACVQ